jgi:hypothetical protein
MTKLATVTVGSGGAADITFSNIPQTYTDLVLKVSGRTDNPATSDTVLINFNGLTTNQSNRRLQGDGSVAISTTGTTIPFIVDGNTATASTFGNVDIYISNYASANYKSLSIDAVRENNSATADAGYLQLWASLWSNVAAINLIQIACQGSSFLQHSTATLYGIKNARKTAGNSIKATGGNISFDGTYVVHTFNSSGTFTPTQAIYADYLVVAGGGGGGTTGFGSSGGGGGGAGGFRTSIGGTGLSLTSTNYSVTVGAGGAGQSSINKGGTGSDSSFSTITSAGGGGGASIGGTGFGYPVGGENGVAGGSGGGAHFNFTTSVAGTGGAGNTPSTSPSQGNNGGIGVGTASNYGAGGGGGAGGVGGNGTSTTGGAGGAGTANSISGSSVTYSGGGGGASYNGGTGGTGGSSVGGNGGTGLASNSTAGTANRGGGGGGNDNGYSSSAGGSGIVIIRYKA